MRNPLSGLSRRELLKLFGLGVGASFANQAIWPRKLAAQRRGITPRGSARNCIVIQNAGAMSPPETLDLKETKYTAPDLDPQRVNSEFYLSRNIFPNFETWAPHASLVRSMAGNPLVHFPAQYYTQAGRPMNPALMREIPALGSLVAYELDSQRREDDAFPTYMSFDLWNIRCPQIGSGMLPPRFAGLDLNTTNVLESFGGGSSSVTTAVPLEDRWEALRRVSEASIDGRGSIGEKAGEYDAHYQYAFNLLQDPRFKAMFDVSEEEKSRYGVPQDPGTCKLGLAMLLARNVLAADAGARFLWVGNAYNGGNGSFDNHDHLYGGAEAPTGGTTQSIYDSGPRLERALGSLVEDLASMPGQEPGKTLLDETLIVMAHEFGRTPDMNSAGGRDHHAPCYTNLFMGGGVKPGRIIGRTDENCAKVVDVGWKHKEQPMMDNVASTIYSALGIDYSKRIEDTPSGRAYEYQQTAPLGGSGFIPLSEIEELFV